MKLYAVDFDSIIPQSLDFTLKELQVSLNEDYESIIAEFKPEALLAEQQSENLVVLEQAVKNEISYGLFYPDIKNLDKKLLAQRIPKVILLDENNCSIKEFEKCGQVVFDLNKYENIANDLIFSLFFHMDIDFD